MIIRLNTQHKTLLGYSGGADSRFLFELAKHQFSKEKLVVVYFDHGLRSKDERIAEKAHVEKVLKDWGGLSIIKRLPVKTFAKQKKLSIEHAARLLRHKQFIALASLHGCSQVLTAHHADDQAETLLMQLIRGGKANVKGMQYSKGLNNEIQLLRPLLGLSRQYILEYLHKNNIAFFTDSTNSDEAYTRNFLRHRVLPLLQEVSPQASTHLAQFAKYLQDTHRYLQTLMQPFQTSLQCEIKQVSLLKHPWINEDPYLVGLMVTWFLKQAYSHFGIQDDKHIQAKHIVTICGHLHLKKWSMNLPQGHLLQVTKDKIIVFFKK